MSFKVTRIVRAARLPRRMPRRAQAKAVLLALADRCDDEGLNAWPAIATVAAETELAERTVQRSLQQLVALELILEQDPPRQHRPRTWMLNLDAIADLSEVTAQTPLTGSRGDHTDTPDGGTAPNSDASEVSIQASGAPLSQSGGTVETARGVSLTPDPILNCSLNNPMNAAQAPRATPQRRKNNGKDAMKAELLDVARTVIATTWPLRSKEELLEKFRAKCPGDFVEADAIEAIQRALSERQVRTA